MTIKLIIYIYNISNSIPLDIWAVASQLGRWRRKMDAIRDCDCLSGRLVNHTLHGSVACRWSVSMAAVPGPGRVNNAERRTCHRVRLQKSSRVPNGRSTSQTNEKDRTALLSHPDPGTEAAEIAEVARVQLFCGLSLVFCFYS